MGVDPAEKKGILTQRRQEVASLRRSRLSIRVLSESRKPIEGITVHVRRRETLGQESREKSNRRLEAKTDSQGRFAFQLPSIPEGYEIGAADGLRSQWISCFPPLRGEVELVLKDLVPLRLRVIDAQNGQPVLEGREVNLYFKPRKEWRYQRLWVDKEGCDANGWREIELPAGESLAYLSQTTLSVDDANTIVDELRGRFPTIVAPPSEDICYATQNRQEAVREIAGDVDVLLVIGSRNSSNSMRLREIAIEMGVSSYLIDSAAEIQPQWLEGKKNVAVTAGASARNVSTAIGRGG